MSMLDRLKNAAKQGASKLTEAVGLGTASLTDNVDPLEESRARVLALRQSMEGMKDTLLQYSRQLLQWSAAASQVSQEWSGLYSASTSRAQSLGTFSAQQARIERAAFALYKDTYGWDVLSVFDDWESETQRVLSDIDKTAKAREHVSSQDDKVRRLRADKERRVKRGEALDRKEEAMLESHEAMLDKYNVSLSNMRLNLDKNLNAFFEQRFATLDKAFVRFMEIQLEFFREGVAASQAYEHIIGNYRKRFPRATSGGRNASTPTNEAAGGSYGPTPDAVSPLPVPNGRQQSQDGPDLLNIPSGAAAPARSKSTPPQQHDDARAPHQRAESQAPQQRVQSPPQQQGRAPHQHHHQHARRSDSPAGDDSGTDSDSSSSSDDSSDEEDAPRRAPAAAPPARKSPEPATIDLFNFPASAAPAASAAAKPASHHAAKPSAAAEDDLSDFFGGGVLKASAPSSKPTPSVGDGDFGFDFSGGGGSSSSHGSKLPTSVSTPALNSKKGDPMHLFDPFAASSPQATASSQSSGRSAASASASSAPSKARSASPPPSAPGTTQSGMANAYIPPTHERDAHIAEQQELKVAALRAAADNEEAALEARRVAENQLEASLSAWENNKDGTRKNIRNLLSSVQTVLWSNSGWKPVSFADLIDFAAVKKAHMKVIRVVHPDKLTDATPEQMVVALRVFDVLNTAFDRFKETGQ